jgi:pseudouridine-5'-phosphate glycosidase
VATPADSALSISDEVTEALAEGRGIVALETTILVHGLPPADAAAVGAAIEAEVRSAGAVPATIGVVSGRCVIGLSASQIERLIESRDDVAKLSSRDLGFAIAARSSGATTVAGTIVLAARAGISVMATGGLGGVHRGAAQSFDESADLTALSRTRVLVVASGVKSILDVPATLERLETLGVPVAAVGQRSFAGFYVADSGIEVDAAVASPDEAAAAFDAHLAVGGTSGMLVANPVPIDDQMDPEEHAAILRSGLAELDARGITGKAVTPFLLAHFASESHGASVAVNTALVLSNAAFAGRAAAALAQARGLGDNP